MDDLAKPGMLAIVNTDILKELLSEVVEKAIERHFEKPKEDKLLSIAQTCSILDVDKSTLWHWDKEGYLKKIYIGGKPRYKECDVMEIVEGRKIHQ